ncbi:MAG: DUF6362 family protein [Pseudomonadota bacterium]
MSTGNDDHGWTAKQVEQRLLEAAETLILCPRARGPRSYGNTMPDPVRPANEAYADDRTRVRRQPTAAALDRMEECWTWINALKEPQDRQLVYRWARAKIGRGRSLKILAMEEGMSDRTLRREISRLCKYMADQLNKRGVVLLPQADENKLMDEDKPSMADAAPAVTTTYWRAADARPLIDRHAPAKRTVSR